MTQTCSQCGTELTARDRTNANSYRDKCMDCIEDHTRERHVDQCEDPDCYVCYDYYLE